MPRLYLMTYYDFLLEEGALHNKQLKYCIYADTDKAKALLVLDYLLDTLENLNPEKCFDKQCTFLFTEFNRIINTESDSDLYFKQYCDDLLTGDPCAIFTDDEKQRLLSNVYHKYHLMLESYYGEYKNVINRLLLCISKLLGNCTLKLN
jgi:hypothetical protein